MWIRAVGLSQVMSKRTESATTSGHSSPVLRSSQGNHSSGVKDAQLAAQVFRLVQCFMSKQMKCSLYLTPEQHALAKTLYISMLRKAVKIAAVPLR